MIGVLLRFHFTQDLSEAKIQQIAKTAHGKFVGLPGLRSKAFTYDLEGKEAINFYVWDSEVAARDFFTQALVDQVAVVYGVRPSIQFVQVAELVENPPTPGP